ncbi:hypothetical protein [Spirochaeta africana]|uniref:Glycoside hydrolase family 5 domain-containing protein n=1 Tax=Spirochaeta africana (strain ATCC 700263 / DSM 8902 / Z-7692) TaxID=889378 RepID=H9UIG6_SPIAZ|nr:hypothetical protein [Spirochaeta africana]AFG37309.1 hypothetical protein Spiaf_1232 [Spirochaeta africana DSM 8902]
MKLCLGIILVCLSVLGCESVVQSTRTDDTPAHTRSTSLGINIHWDFADEAWLEEVFADLVDMNVGMVRIDWEWRRVEYEQGSYDWSIKDTLMQLAYQYGLDIYPMVLYPPEWAQAQPPEPGHYSAHPATEHYQAYSDFVMASIDRFGPEGDAPGDFRPITHWEIWNEPNTAYFWSPEPDHAAYAELLKTTAADIRAAHPDIIIVHGGLATADFVWMNEAYGGKGETDLAYAAAFDVLSVHPYFIAMDGPDAGPRAPGAIDDDNPDFAAIGFIGSIEDPGYYPKVYNLRNLMSLRDPQPDKPIWITEVGFFVGEDHPAAATAEQHAALLQETIDYTFENFGSTPYRDHEHVVGVDKLFWFNYEDYGSDTDVGSWGLITQDGTRRPAFDIFEQLLQR